MILYTKLEKSEELDFSIRIRVNNLLDDEIEFVKEELICNIEHIKINVQKETDMVFFHIKHFI